MSRRVKTVPEPIKDYRPVIVTGNDYISLPEIDKYGSVMSVTFLNQAQASLFEVRGTVLQGTLPQAAAIPETASTSEAIATYDTAATSDTVTTPKALIASDVTGRGDQQIPFIMPLLEWNGMQVDLRGVRPKVDLKWDWVPEFTWDLQDLPDVSDGPIRLCLRIVAPPDEKGFCYILELDRAERESSEGTVAYTAGDDSTSTDSNTELNRQDKSEAMKVRAKLGLVCSWGSSMFRVFTSRPISCARSCRYDKWTQSVVAEAMGPLPLFGFSINSSEDFNSVDIEESSDDLCRIKVSQDREVARGDKVTVAYYVAFNREADGARTTGVHLKRVGWEELEERAYSWLRMRRRSLNASNRLESVVNRNLLFNYFFATGKTLDSESLVAVTSRSPRYYVSAAFWARDVLLWSMPALVLTDTARARDVLLYSTRIGTLNVGDHALYMDGTALYPGFELDEAAAHIVGLGTYLDATSDYSILGEPGMLEGIRRTLAAIEEWLVRDDCGKPVLCRTFLDPSDDPVEFPFLTYSNVLLWKAWMIASCVFDKLGGEYAHAADELRKDATALEESIRRYCVVEGPFGPMYAWAVDLEPIKKNKLGSSSSSVHHSSVYDGSAIDRFVNDGATNDSSICNNPACVDELIFRVNYEIYDNPPGSLELIRHYGFPHDEETSKILRNTQRWIRSRHNQYYFDGKFGGPGSAHSPHPWPMAAANTILAEVAEYEATGTCDIEAVKQAVKLLTTAPMDGGIVCESIDPVTGVAKTGLALATGAGFVAYALWRGHKIGLNPFVD